MNKNAVFTASEVTRVTGLTYRQLDHILRSGVIRASGGGGRGRGDPRFFTMRDMVSLRVARDLLDGGLAIRAFQAIFRSLERDDGAQTPADLRDALLWTDRHDVVVLPARSSGLRLPLTRSAVTHLVDIGPVAQEVRQAVEEETPKER